MASSCGQKLDEWPVAPSSEARVVPQQTNAVVRGITSFPGLICAVLAARVFWSCKGNVADPDIWWHLLNARYIVSNHAFPNVDTRCFTTLGMAWIDHAWLSELIYYFAFRTLGLFALFAVPAICISAISIAVFLLSMREGADPLASGLATLLGGVLAMVGYGPRTHVFGWLCFVVLFAILIEFRSKRSAPLWIVPLLFCLWINLHGSWVVGAIVFAIFVGVGLLRRDLGQLTADPWTKPELKKLLAWGGVSALALFVNPFGYRLVWYPFDMMFHRPLNNAFVQEFASINFHDSRGTLVALVMGAVFALAFLGRKRWRLDEAVLCAFVIYCGITHIRFLFLAGIVLPVILAPKIGSISSYDPRHERRAVNAVLLLVAFGVLLFGFPSAKTIDAQMTKSFPTGAVDYLRSHPQQGHIFNPDDWGGYLEWKMPGTLTFMDTRDDIFEYRGVLQDYLDIVLIGKPPQQLLDRYQVSYVLYPPDSPLAYYLANAPQWERVYTDKKAVIYRRIETRAGQ